MLGVVPVGDVARDVVEVGDDGEVRVSLRETDVGADSVFAQRRDLCRQRVQRVDDAAYVLRRCLVGEGQQHDVAEHHSSPVGAAVDGQGRAGDVTGVFRAQERADSPEVLGAPDLTRRDAAEALARVLVVERRERRAVSCRPGSSEFTVTPSEPPRRERLEEAGDARPRGVRQDQWAIGWRTAIDVIANTRPQLRSRISGTAS